MEMEADQIYLRAENADLRQRLEAVLAQNAALVAHVHELEGRLAKDSHNSSKPPSTDGPKRRPALTRSLREKTGKKSGGQLGHPGETLHLVATPDVVEEHRPAACVHCHARLLADAEVVSVERRQVADVPPIHLVVTEHQALRVRCPACQQVSVGAFPAAATSRIQYGPRLQATALYLNAYQLLPSARTCDLLGDVCGAVISEGTLATWLRQAAETLEPVETQIKRALGQAAVLHHDETGIRVAGLRVWAHDTSSATLTHYAAHAKRGHEATDAIGILPTYTGVSVHDGWKAYQTYTGCQHALCNVHHLRELTYLAEEEHQAWATDLKALLHRMHTATATARAAGQPALEAGLRTALTVEYQTILAQGLVANPPPERRPHQRGRLKQSLARNLLDRLLHGQAMVLAFLEDLRIPFDNNLAERDVRMLKTQQKISGGFRSWAGAHAFLRLRGYLSTLRKQGAALLDALYTVALGSPLYPAFA